MVGGGWIRCKGLWRLGSGLGLDGRSGGLGGFLGVIGCGAEGSWELGVGSWELEGLRGFR